MPTKTRTYNSSRRTRQAAQTREEVLDAAIALFGESGWTGTTLAAIAERAGVAVETIYAGFGSKKGLLRAAIDVAVVGDTADIPLAQRPESLRLGEGTLDERLQAAATLLADVHERSIGVWRAFTEAARTDAEVEQWRGELERGRRQEIAMSFERMFGYALDEGRLDLMWAILGPEVYAKLVFDAPMSRAGYEACMIDAVRALVPAIAS